MLRIGSSLLGLRSALPRGAAIVTPSASATTPRLCRTSNSSSIISIIIPRSPPPPRLLSTSASRRLLLSSRWPLPRVRLARNARSNSGKTAVQEGSGSQAAAAAPRSVSDRFKELSRKYGWAAVGVYFGLSALDFPFCFLAVRLIGPERIGEVEHAIVDGFWRLVGTFIPSMLPEDRAKQTAGGGASTDDAESTEQPIHQDNASIWTQLLLAYGVHKSLIFFRVPLTAAVTPKVVKTLRSWGWNIGRPSKTVKAS